MTVTAIRSVSTDLPHADIYLNDLWEIEKLFTEAYGRAFPEIRIDFEYQVDGLRITTREELSAHGGKASKFTLYLVRVGAMTSSRSLLSLSGIVDPQIRVPYELEEFEWELYGRVQVIFNARKKAVKSFVTGLPSWIRLVVLAPFTYICMSVLSQIRFFQSRPYTTLSLTLLFNAALVGVYAFGLFGKSRVHFQNSRDDERARATRLEERVEKLIWLAVGFILGVLGSVLASFYKH